MEQQKMGASPVGSAELPTVSDVTAIVSRYVEANVAMAVLDNEVPYDEAADRAWTELLDALERLYAAAVEGRTVRAKVEALPRWTDYQDGMDWSTNGRWLDRDEVLALLDGPSQSAATIRDLIEEILHNHRAALQYLAERSDATPAPAVAPSNSED